VTIAFKLDGEKVTGFSLVPPEGSPVAYARVEEK
jgi:hypothetical protein